MLPLALLGAVSGALCERFDRRRIQLVGTACMILSCSVQGLLAYQGTIQLWHIFLGAGLNGIFWTIDMPARRTLLGEAAGSGLLGAAMSLDSVTSNGTRMLGPLLGGLLLELIGLDGTFFLGAGLYSVGLLALLCLPWRDNTRTSGSLSLWRSILEGLQHIRGNRALLGTLWITIVFNLWAFPFTSMVPVIGREVLGLSPFPVGLLASAEGAGALCSAFLIAFLAPPRWYRKLYLYGTVLCLLAILFFSQMRWLPLSALFLLLAGAGTAAFATMQATLVFLAAPAQARGRIMGVLSVCIGTGPIGFLHVGWLATWLGAPTALAIIALEGLLALFIVCWYWPEVR
jgi:MFS family permease